MDIREWRSRNLTAAGRGFGATLRQRRGAKCRAGSFEVRDAEFRSVYLKDGRRVQDIGRPLISSVITSSPRSGISIGSNVDRQFDICLHPEHLRWDVIASGPRGLQGRRYRQISKMWSLQCQTKHGSGIQGSRRAGETLNLPSFRLPTSRHPPLTADTVWQERASPVPKTRNLPSSCLTFLSRGCLQLQNWAIRSVQVPACPTRLWVRRLVLQGKKIKTSQSNPSFK